MNPIQLLMDEHRVIEGAIDALEAYAKAAQGDTPPAREDLGTLVRFIREFADAHHHGKEEDILFAAMAEAGMPKDVGPLGVMLHEHVEGRGYTKSLGELAEGEGAFDEEETGQLVWAARSYANLLRAHIQKEDQVLYPMADQMLPEPTWKAIEAQFVTFEGEEAHAKRATELRAAAEALRSKYVG